MELRVDPDAGDNIRVTLTGAIGEKGWRERIKRFENAEIEDDAVKYLLKNNGRLN